MEEKVMDLLRNGAHLDDKAVQLILPSTIESFLDSCISESGGLDTAEDFSVTFDYSLLAPQVQHLPITLESPLYNDKRTAEEEPLKGASFEIKSVEDLDGF